MMESNREVHIQLNYQYAPYAGAEFSSFCMEAFGAMISDTICKSTMRWFTNFVHENEKLAESGKVHQVAMYTAVFGNEPLNNKKCWKIWEK
jgi:hypothetical protein